MTPEDFEKSGSALWQLRHSPNVYIFFPAVEVQTINEIILATKFADNPYQQIRKTGLRHSTNVIGHVVLRYPKIGSLEKPQRFKNWKHWERHKLLPATFEVVRDPQYGIYSALSAGQYTDMTMQAALLLSQLDGVK